MTSLHVRRVGSSCRSGDTLVDIKLARSLRDAKDSNADLAAKDDCGRKPTRTSRRATLARVARLFAGSWASEELMFRRADTSRRWRTKLVAQRESAGSECGWTACWPAHRCRPGRRCPIAAGDVNTSCAVHPRARCRGVATAAGPSKSASRHCSLLDSGDDYCGVRSLTRKPATMNAAPIRAIAGSCSPAMRPMLPAQDEIDENLRTAARIMGFHGWPDSAPCVRPRSTAASIGHAQERGGR